ncbi:MAG TPA: DUF1499 domain-containing protein [Burkholderiales bacterium]|nr:DUF1499 domain-containing protein [Burkholderiales bacterium]
MDAGDLLEKLQRPRSPNSWLVAPSGFRLQPDAIAPVFDVPAPVLRDAFRAAVRRSAGAEVVDESSRGIHVVATTRLMRFEDDVWALFIPVSEERATLAVYSASRVGRWDFGTNRRRVTRWIGQLEDSIRTLQRDTSAI